MNTDDLRPEDEQLRQQINDDLLSDERISSQNLRLSLQDGVATVSGSVNSYRRKLLVQQIIAAHEGIRDIRNQIEVVPSPALSDQDIAAKVRAALDASADITKEAIAVAVAAGKVTLSGNVATPWERAVAEDIVRGVRGVRDVINMLVTDAMQKLDDHELTNSIRGAISRARGLNLASLRVAVSDNTVVLSGTVSALWQKELAQQVVERFGMLHIRNEISVTG